MKIQPISINNYYQSKNISLKKNKNVSFGVMPASPQDILEMRLFARDVFENAQKVYNDGSMLISKAYDKLNHAKAMYIDALTYSDILNKGLREKEVNVPNGNTLEIISTYNRAFEIQPTYIKVFDKNKKHIQDIYFYNGFVNKIVEHLTPNTSRISTFDGYNVEIIDDLDNKSKDISAKYSFYQGELTEIKTNISTAPFASYAGNYYAYKDGKLFVNEQDTKSLFSGGYSVKHRYNFMNGYLANYYKSFCIDDKKQYNWAESCHFNKDEIIGKTHNASQKSSSKNITAESATFLLGNRFFSGNNIICQIGDDKIATFCE